MRVFVHSLAVCYCRAQGPDLLPIERKSVFGQFVSESLFIRWWFVSAEHPALICCPSSANLYFGSLLLSICSFVGSLFLQSTGLWFAVRRAQICIWVVCLGVFVHSLTVCFCRAQGSGLLPAEHKSIFGQFVSEYLCIRW